MSESSEVDAVAGTWSRWSHLWQRWADLLDPAQPARMGKVSKSELGSLHKVWEQLESNYPELVTEPLEERVRWKREQSRELVRLAGQWAPSEWSQRVRWRVCEILDAGNRLHRWQIPIPEIPVSLPPVKASWLQPLNFEQMVEYQDLAKDFALSLGQPISGLSVEARWGRVLGAAMLYGGLLQTRWLAALPDALANAPAHCCWVELYHYPDGRDSGHPPVHMRWYPDPVTRYLVVNEGVNAYGPQPRSTAGGQRIYRLIRRYARESGGISRLPRSWQQLRAVVATRAALYVPPYVLGAATGTFNSASVPPEVFERLRKPPTPQMRGAVGDEQPVVARRSVGFERSESSDDGRGEATETDLPARRELAKEIRKDLNNPRPDRIAAWRARQSEGGDSPNRFPASMDRLAEWCEWQFRAARGRKPLRPQTVYEHYNAVGARLVGQLGDHDPAHLSSADEFVEMYVAAIEDCEEGADPGRIARGLRSFHDFLIDRYDAPDLAGSGVFNVAGSASAPDPNLIDPAAFEQAMELIGRRFDAAPETRDTLQLAAALGYYAGLRRSETVALRVCDIEVGPDCDVRVRPYENRVLKSRAANRLVPLGLLAPATWIDLLQHRVRSHTGDPEALLLPVPGGGPIANRGSLFAEVTRALAEVTNDPTLRFHHLRHSFASRLLLLLETAEQPKIGSPPWFPDLLGGLEPWAARRGLLGSAPLQRRSLRLVALLMGHASVTVTLAHYVHVLDYLTARYFRAAIPESSPEDVARITGYSVSRVYGVRQRANAGSTAELLDALTDQRLPRDERAKTPAALIPLDEWPVRVPEGALHCRELLGEAINACHRGGGAGVAGQYPWSVDAVANLAATAESDVPWRARKRARATTERLVDPPRLQREWQMAGTVQEILSTWNGAGANAWLAHAVQDGIGNQRVGIRVTAMKHLRRWVALLEQADLAGRVTLEHRASSGPKAGRPLAQRRYWEHATQWSVADGGPASAGRSAGARGEIIVREVERPSDAKECGLYPLQWSITLEYLWRKLTGDM